MNLHDVITALEVVDNLPLSNLTQTKVHNARLFLEGYVLALEQVEQQGDLQVPDWAIAYVLGTVKDDHTGDTQLDAFYEDRAAQRIVAWTTSRLPESATTITNVRAWLARYWSSQP